VVDVETFGRWNLCNGWFQRLSNGNVWSLR
jgi:hypothetical protein